MLQKWFLFSPQHHQVIYHQQAMQHFDTEKHFMFTWALEISSWPVEAAGTAPQSATTKTIITVLTTSATSMIPFFYLRAEGTNSESSS